MEQKETNILGTEKISRLILKFAVPSIIGMLVNAMYNIVDQIFIGQGVGILGNAATNVAMPLTTICTSLGLLFGVGGASGFNLELGRRNKEKAGQIAGNAIFMLVICGVLVSAVTLTFLNPLMRAFGASDTVLPYALDYTGITAFGFTFMILSSGLSNLIRADGKPTYSMICLVTGAVLNMILDPILIFVFDMGIQGAAIATVFSQFVSCTLALLYLRRFRTIKLKREYFRPSLSLTKLIASLGLAACFNQLAMTVVQIVMNNTLTYYGALSRYGSDIPLACVGVVTKVNIIYISFVVGMAQGGQPIFSFNYGAGNYDRVRETYRKLISASLVVSLIAFLCFQLFPRQILSLFGQGDELYYEFGVRYLRIFMMMVLINGIQPITSNFLTAIGKATRGIFISLTRQVLFLLPLILVLPLVFGIDGVVYAGPLADAASCIVAILIVRSEFRKMNPPAQTTSAA